MSDAWRTDPSEHHQDSYDPRECVCGMNWPCALGDALSELAATRSRLEAAEAALANVGRAPKYPLVRCHECGGTGVLEVEPIRPTDWRDELDAPDEGAGE